MTAVQTTPSEDQYEALLVDFRAEARWVFIRHRIPIDDAQDLLQEAFLSYLVKRESVAKPLPWLRGTLRNLCRLYWRERRRRLYRAVDGALLDEIAEPVAPAQEMADRRRDLDRVLATLSPRCRALLTLRYDRAWGAAEVADALGYSESGIYKMTERCLAAITRQLSRVGSKLRLGRG